MRGSGVSVSNWLKGSLDYYIPSPSNFVVIEAKQSDLTKGFTQLAVELIALDRWVESESPILYRAVSTGEIWRFGLYDRAGHHVVEYLPLHPVPQDLEFLTLSGSIDAHCYKLRKVPLEGGGFKPINFGNADDYRDFVGRSKDDAVLS